MQSRIGQTVIGPAHKSFPRHLHGRGIDALHEPLSRFPTPLVTLDRSAIGHNTAVMSAWAAEQGVALAPHGKTTMAPQLWRALLEAGAWGLTFATPWQAQVAHAHGVPRVMLTAPVLDDGSASWLADAMSQGLETVVWVDDVEAVERMNAVLPGRVGVLPVLVELGGAGGRTGARGADAALAIARAVEASPQLRLVGVAGYEGAFAHDRSTRSLDAVRRYLEELRVLTELLELPDGAIVTAGGSAYPDLVASALAPSRDRFQVILRPGAFQMHDDGFYAGISPLRHELRAAMHGWARVVSAPEPRLALLDGGKRDFSFDEGLPIVQRRRGSEQRLHAAVTQLNDQHAFVSQPSGDPLQIGDIVRLGLSHPCTVLDKWRLIPLVDDAGADEPLVIGAIETWF